MIELPSAFKERMKERLGDSFERFRSALEEQSPVSVRINPRKQNYIPTDQIVPWCSTGFYLQERPKFTFDPLFHAGTYYVQEASSMFIEQVFRQHINGSTIKILDLSAAPGGKSTHLLSLIGDDCVLVSNDVIRSRAAILAENILKWGYGNCIVTNNDPHDFQRLPGLFDVIVVDAPCSGEGLFRKEPDAMKEWSPENVNLCAARQRRILADVWPALKENGILIYSTCTYNDQENVENLQWLKQHNDIEFISLELEKRWGVTETTLGDAVGYHFFPHLTRGEGFFISAIRKKDASGPIPKLKKTLLPPTKRTAEVVNSWVAKSELVQFFQHQDFVVSFPSSQVGTLELVKQNLKLVQAGTTFASVKHDKTIPEHGAAMSVDLDKRNFNSIDLGYDQAIQYLRRETFAWTDQPKGFQLVTYKNVPLGWINSLGNRFNNLYPIDWRIRSQVS